MKKIKILITGANSGIGKALYDGLKKANYYVYGIGRDVQIDLREDIPQLTPICAEIWDVLINCAGIMPFEESKDVFEVNFWGTLKMITAVTIAKYGCIINVASVSGFMAEPDLPIYAASKAAVISITKSLALKLAPKKIRVNCISPGFYCTNLAPGELPQELIDKVPLKYEELPEKMLPIVEMIINTDYMTGSNIVVDGGLSL